MTRSARGTAMITYILIGIGLFNVVAVYGLILIRIELRGHIKNSLTLQNALRAAVRRLIVSLGLFGVPILVYLFEGNKRFATTMPASYALAWGAACVVSLMILIGGLITLIRHANREKNG